MIWKSWQFLKANARWLAAGALLTFISSFGQTFFIALFAGPIRDEVGLSHAGWGSLYAAATLGSAVAIAWFGKLADLRPLVLPAVGVVLALASAALVMSAAQSAWLLAIALFGLRFCGQGMSSHVAVTATARWFSANRGRALAVTALGLPLGETLLPGIVVAVTGLVGWRTTWVGIALVLICVLAPLLALLLAQERQPRTTTGAVAGPYMPPAGLGGRQWRRAEVLRHAYFWALLPGACAAPFIGTAVLFQSVPLMAAKSWSLELYALAFPAYAAASVGGSLAAGILVDRYRAPRLLPVTLLPMAGGLLVAALAEPAWAVFPYLALFGLTTGLGMTTMNALWAELYGTRHLGAIRGLISAIMVFATALGPGVTGILLDLGTGLEAQFLGMGCVTLLLALSFFAISRRLLAMTS